MHALRDILGYMLGLAFCIAAMMLCGLAWLGLQNAFGWEWALFGVVASIVARINGAVIVGLYFYAHNMMGWPVADSMAFAVPGLLIIAPVVAVEFFGILVGTPVRR